MWLKNCDKCSYHDECVCLFVLVSLFFYLSFEVVFPYIIFHMLDVLLCHIGSFSIMNIIMLMSFGLKRNIETCAQKEYIFLCVIATQKDEEITYIYWCICFGLNEQYCTYLTNQDGYVHVRKNVSLLTLLLWLLTNVCFWSPFLQIFISNFYILCKSQ